MQILTIGCVSIRRHRQHPMPGPSYVELTAVRLGNDLPAKVTAVCLMASGRAPDSAPGDADAEHASERDQEADHLAPEPSAGPIDGT